MRLEGERAELSSLLLNLLTMDFSLHERYADLLRYNSFSRARLRRTWLGTGFAAGIDPKPSGKRFTLKSPSERKRFAKSYGASVVDFGAGHLDQTNMIRSAGFDCTPFEPYRVGDGTDAVDKRLSVELTREFLKVVASGKRFDSVVFSAIMNSVPFAEDRAKLLCIASWLAPRCWTNAQSATQPHYQATRLGRVVGGSNQYIRLDYEEHVTLGSLDTKPKMQRYYTTEEIYTMLKRYFTTAKVWEASNSVVGVAQRPLRESAAELAAAVRFEFDLPYPDGSRMGLAEEALAAFGKRLSLDLHALG